MFGPAKADPAIEALKEAARVEKSRPAVMKGPWGRSGGQKGERLVKAPAQGEVPHRMQ